MRDRLIELIGEARAMEASGIKCKVSNEYIADHLLANGAIFPNVKIGDKLYCLNARKTKIYEFTITSLEICIYGIKIWGVEPYSKTPTWIRRP